MFDPRLLALLSHTAQSLRAALNIIYVLEGVSEFLFLLGAVWAPPGTIHFRAVVLETLGEIVKRVDGSSIVKEIVHGPNHQ